MSALGGREVHAMFEHRSVMLDEVVGLIAPRSPKTIVDCTVGGAGHAAALLEACPETTLIALDRDPSAVNAARKRLARFGLRAQVRHARFSELSDVLCELGCAAVDALVADLGVSSPQLDTPERGFSLRTRGPLDMRMDPSSGSSAAEILQTIDERTLADVIHGYGEERHARRVARAIVAERPQTTEALASLVRRLVRKSADGLDPATRTFQALRMLVNRELEELDALLALLPEVLADGGVAVILSFHSLEDRAVKHAFREGSQGCLCPPKVPVCTCGHTPVFELLTRRAMRPGAAECEANARAHSALLRAVVRLARRPA